MELLHFSAFEWTILKSQHKLNLSNLLPKMHMPYHMTINLSTSDMSAFLILEQHSQKYRTVMAQWHWKEIWIQSLTNMALILPDSVTYYRTAIIYDFIQCIQIDSVIKWQSKSMNAWRSPLKSIKFWGEECIQLHFYSSICIHGPIIIIIYEINSSEQIYFLYVLGNIIWSLEKWTEIITLHHHFTEVTDPISCPNMIILSIFLTVKTIICISK
jgi:hypothetical protein